MDPLWLRVFGWTLCIIGGLLIAILLTPTMPVIR